MARKQVDKQLRLFGLGDLGDEDDGREPPPGVRSGYESWEEVMADLGRLLRQARFEAYLARQGSQDSGQGC